MEDTMDNKQEIIKDNSNDTRVFILDGRFMYNKSAAHKYISKKMKFPDYYGENLDALYDMLTEMDIPTRIQVINTKLIIKNLKDYGTSLLDVFRQGAKANRNLTLMIFDMDTAKTTNYKISSDIKEADESDSSKITEEAPPTDANHTDETGDSLKDEESFNHYLDSQEL
ncbi:MAG: barstar family protein [Clostridiaceae bacterium]